MFNVIRVQYHAPQGKVFPLIAIPHGELLPWEQEANRKARIVDNTKPYRARL